MKKIQFIEPASPNLHIFSQCKIPRLGSFMLGTMMKQRGWQAEVQLEELHPIRLERAAQADIVGISTTTSTAPGAYAIADQLRRRGTTIVLGGPHVTFFPDEALKHCDFVIRGEGEAPFMRFIDAYEGNQRFDEVPSLSFYDSDGRIRHNPTIDRPLDLDLLPHPDFSLCQEVRKNLIGGKHPIPVQTSRGCPYGCSFCSVTGMFGRRYRYRSTANVLAELRQYDDPRNFIFFCDDNFTENRRRVKELLNAMIAEKFRFQWSTQARVDAATDPELVRLMVESGCHTLYIGFESVHAENLKKSHKGQTVEQIRNAIRVFRGKGIHIHGMFMIGFDDDNQETIRQTVSFAKESGITSAQFLILTPLPGSQIFEQHQKDGRLLSKDWALYDAHHVVFQPARLSPLELQLAQVFSHDSFYSLSQVLRKLVTGNLTGAAIGFYARRTKREWKRRMRDFIQELRAFFPSEIRPERALPPTG